MFKLYIPLKPMYLHLKQTLNLCVEKDHTLVCWVWSYFNITGSHGGTHVVLVGYAVIGYRANQCAANLNLFRATAQNNRAGSRSGPLGGWRALAAVF